MITIFLNGHRVFYGMSAYQSRDRSFVGVVGLNDVVYLNYIKRSDTLQGLKKVKISPYFRNEDLASTRMYQLNIFHGYISEDMSFYILYTDFPIIRFQYIGIHI